LLITEAYAYSASDIHLEATRDGLDVRYRIDGVLSSAPAAPQQMQLGVVSRLKLLADLDIADRRRPQDGRIRVRLADREMDLRVSTVPTMFGESLVLRLLDRGGRPVELCDLGMSESVLTALEGMIRKPHGIVLVTGPTGSGKTTTLYSGLRTRDSSREKIITVEDPVEYQLTGITQVPVNRQAAVTFPTALRAILRQDPDVVMIGEMRDQETAEIAVQAAMTGHLVMSTLHTNDAVGALPRLVDLGIPPYFVAATLEGVLAQRLVRRICTNCTTDYILDDSSRRAATGVNLPSRLFKGAGCDRCRGTGYKGRVGVFELVSIGDELRELITQGKPKGEVRARAAELGFSPMILDGWTKVRAGITTVEEVLRAVPL
jgi:type II secretory ATPase GspE/PulE/Tfp pilus assembly ATPase PilB-like protein